MRFEPIDSVRVTIPRAVLASIFDECDRYDRDETGGRIIGTYTYENEQLVVHVKGVIGPGHNARRSATSFFQDGEYQERVFRKLEETNPNIEHLGNWHSHHVNGYPNLSSGDIDTYRRTVNHPQHNTTFFYALLVVSRNTRAQPQRYSIKHYVMRRKDDKVYEIPPARIQIVEQTPLGLLPDELDRSRESTADSQTNIKLVRVYDRDILAEFYSGLRPYTSKLGVYWRGSLALHGGSSAEVVVLETEHSGQTTYSVMLRKLPDCLAEASEVLATRQFSSASAAVIATERVCNRMLYEQLQGGRKHMKNGERE